MISWLSSHLLRLQLNLNLINHFIDKKLSPWDKQCLRLKCPHWGLFIYCFILLSFLYLIMASDGISYCSLCCYGVYGQNIKLCKTYWGYSELKKENGLMFMVRTMHTALRHAKMITSEFIWIVLCCRSVSGDFSGWSTSIEQLPLDSSGIPPGVVVCYLPTFRWVQFSDQENWT